MNRHITRLQEIATKSERKIIGLMSGTSLDGLDIAICRLKGSGKNTSLHLDAFETIPYAEKFKQEVRSIFSKEMVSLQKLCLLNSWIAVQHAGMIKDCLQKWKKDPGEIDLIASHGQTIYHAPKSLHKLPEFGNATLQIGDGDHLAMHTGIICLSDFRQKNIAGGGEGAPLAVYGDYILFASETRHRILLNIGGIANFTYIPAGATMNAVVCTDTGPGNTLMDAYTQKHFKKAFDENAEIGLQGKLNEPLLHSLLDHPFFTINGSRTTGPELFNLEYLELALQKSNSITLYDCMATLNAFTAHSIVRAISNVLGSGEKAEVYVSGGGMHNPLLIENLKSLLPNLSFESSEKLGVNPDAKEAILFAILANECICRDHAATSGSRFPEVGMGKISFPT